MRRSRRHRRRITVGQRKRRWNRSRGSTTGHVGVEVRPAHLDHSGEILPAWDAAAEHVAVQLEGAAEGVELREPFVASRAIEACLFGERRDGVRRPGEEREAEQHAEESQGGRRNEARPLRYHFGRAFAGYRGSPPLFRRSLGGSQTPASIRRCLGHARRPIWVSVGMIFECVSTMPH